MIGIDYSVLAAHALKRKVVTAREPGLSRDRGIAIVAQAMRESARSRRRVRWWAAGLVVSTVAAAALLTLPRYLRPISAGTAHKTSTCGNSQGACSPTPVAAIARIDIGHMNGQVVEPGRMIQADAGHPSQVDFESGTRLLLTGNTMVGYDEGAAMHRFSLNRGSVHLEVAKLHPGQRFLLNTLDSEVEVRGTVFDVAVVDPKEGCGQRTRVSVQEGVVEIRTEFELHTLRAGEHWPLDCPVVTKQVSVPSSKGPVATVGTSRGGGLATDDAPAKDALFSARSPGTSSEARNPSATDLLPASDLAEQNDIYARASAERHQGRVSEALALYGQLLTRFPRSALVESACVQRLRLLGQVDRAQAAKEAARYLVQFPRGFARAEAEALVDAP